MPLDECVPRKLGRSLTGHLARTVPQEGWSGKKNGALLAVMAAAGFEVLLTVDQGVRYQQNLASAGVAVIVMIAPTNDIVDLLPLVPAVLAALMTVRPGDVVEVS